MRVPRVVWRLLKLLKAEKFSLVHSHGYFADICAIPVARMLGVKTISTCHGFISNDKKLILYNKANLCVIKLCHKIIAVSVCIKNQLLDAGVKSHKITVIPNAVETDFEASEIKCLRNKKRMELQINDDELVIGYLGRLSTEKGVKFLIEAVADLIGAGFPVRLLIVGDGDERTNLEAQVAKSGVAQMVIFAGFQSETQCWLSAFDLFVLPSLTEGTPLALLEAMALGLPVVASNVGGVPNVVTDGQDGLLVEAGSVESIVKAIDCIIRDTVLYKKLSKEASKKIKSGYEVFSWTNKIEKLYFKK